VGSATLHGASGSADRLVVVGMSPTRFYWWYVSGTIGETIQDHQFNWRHFMSEQAIAWF